MRRLACVIAVLTSVLLLGSGGAVHSAERLGRSRLSLTFDEEFDGPLSWCSDACTGQTWRTRMFHSGDTPMSRGVGMGSDSEVAVDRAYMGLGIDPFAIQVGILAIKVRPAAIETQEAIRSAWRGSYAGERAVPRFTSGFLSTEFSFRQRYGYFEIRAKVPALVGGWPAFWMLGSKPGTYDEIDVFEILTGNPQVQHLGHQWGSASKLSARADLKAVDLSSDFHIFGVLWNEREIVYYRDNTEIARFPNKGLHQPMYLIVSIGMDGDWNKQQGFRSTSDAAGDLLVDYVRAYQVR